MSKDDEIHGLSGNFQIPVHRWVSVIHWNLNRADIKVQNQTNLKMTHRKKSQNNKAAMDTEYEIRRQRNNDAVRKSREKAREKSQQVSQRMKLLRNENDSLEEKKKLLKKELSMLKEMFLAYNGSESNQQGNELAKLLLTSGRND